MAARGSHLPQHDSGPRRSSRSTHLPHNRPHCVSGAAPPAQLQSVGTRRLGLNHLLCIHRAHTLRREVLEEQGREMLSKAYIQPLSQDGGGVDVGRPLPRDGNQLDMAGKD